VAVAAALKGFGVWSLLAQTLTSTTVAGLLLWGLSSWRPAWRVNRSALRDLFGYSAHLLGFNGLNYWERNLDNLLVGRFIGSIALGNYGRAYNLMLLPISQVTSVVTRVMFPALSAIQHDTAQVKRIYLRATRTIALITFPIMIGLLVVARPFVVLVFGEKWREVVPIIQILCLAGMTDSITTTTGWIFNSQGRTDIQFKWELFCATARGLLFFVGLRWGIAGVAWSYVLGEYLLFLYPSWSLAGRLIGLSFGEMVSNLTKTILCASAMGLVVWALGRALPPDWPAGAALAVQISAGALVYLVLIDLAGLEAYRESRLLMREQLGRSRA